MPDTKKYTINISAQLQNFDKLDKELNKLKGNKELNINTKDVELLQSKTINSSQGKDIFAKLVKENKSPKAIQKELGATLINDENEIVRLIEEVISQNPTLRDDYKAGKTRAQGFVMGQIMKKTGGKVNPGVANKLIIKELLK